MEIMKETVVHHIENIKNDRFVWYARKWIAHEFSLEYPQKLVFDSIYHLTRILPREILINNPRD